MSIQYNVISVLQSIKSDNGNKINEQRKDLMNIVKKIDVEKKLYTEYESDWKNPLHGELLDFQGWIQVLSLLYDLSEESEIVEYRLKILNTILKGIDIVRANPEFNDEKNKLKEIENKIIELIQEGKIN